MDLVRLIAVVRTIDRGATVSAVVIAIALSLSFVAGFVTTRRAQAQLLSPGPLARAHQELEGDSNCARCHESGRRVGASLCFECHEALGRRVNAGLGLHGREYRNRDCGSCHVDHVGANAPLIRWPEGRRERFDHRQTGWPLEGAHITTGCDACHDDRTSHGNRTYLGASPACRTCHEDPHEGRLGGECQSCHVAERWTRVTVGAFDHDRTRYPLRGEHRNVDCAGCHGTPARYRGIEFSTCASCHQDPHQGRYSQPCASCHTETGWNDLTGVRDDHPGLSLAGGHAPVTCERCHDAGTAAAPTRGSACVSCHHRVHEADLGTNCAACHGGIRWMGLRPAVGMRAHERTPFPLHGRHVDVACDACHSPDRPRDARYRQLAFETCDGCHEDPHRGTLADVGDGKCSTCHDDAGFRPSHFGIAGHAHTRFPLDGMHEAVPCSGCHDTSRPRVSFAVERQTCADCHENPHGDQFAREMSEGGCARCHATSGWDRPRIDHSIFPLTGAHAQTQCDSCHSPTDADRRSGNGASYRGLPHDCAGCHDDTHAGQFRLSEPIRECESCHDTSTFEIANFDHAASAAYPLDGAHAEVECSSCHPTVELRNGTETVRWRLGYRGCADCHANPHAGGGAR